jgi:predicted ATPase
VAQVIGLLETPGVRLVTLTGPGGIGKTRLALAVGERLVDHYPATVFVPLDSIAQPELVVPRMAAAAGASLEGVSRPLDVLVAHLAEAPTLFILDNLEQVIAAGSDLDELLGRSPGVKILATSRTVLRLRAEHEYRVEPLGVPVFSERPQLQELASLPAVELFVDRARAVRRHFALTQDNAFAVAEICRRLDGLPLAIELAAARVRLMEPVELLARLGTRLDSLGPGPADLPERQRTLRATIDWSVGLLADSERDMLASLSVFVDGWTIDAAVHIAGGDDDRILDLLDALCSHSLVTLTAADSGPRFHMLETVREFASEMAAATLEVNSLRERHAVYFRDFVERTYWPFPDETSWAERLQTEEGNLRLMIQWFLDQDITPLPHLFRILWRFWQLRDRMAEGRSWIEELMPRVATLDDHRQAELWLTSAMTAAEVGDDDSALAATTEIDRLKGRLNDRDLESAAQLALSWTLPILNDLDGALQAAMMSRQGFLVQDEQFMAVNAAFTLGMLELARGQYEAAHRHLAEVRSASEQLGTSWLTSVATIQLSTLAAQSGRLDEARTLLAQSLDMGTSAQRSTLTLSFCLVALANLALADGNARLAATALGAADGLRARAGLRAWPMLRPGEADLRARIERNLGSENFKEAFANGSQSDRGEAIALIRGSVS